MKVYCNSVCSFTWIYHFPSQIHYISTRKFHLITKILSSIRCCAVCSFEIFHHYKRFLEAAEVECGVSPLVLFIRCLRVFYPHPHAVARVSSNTPLRMICCIEILLQVSKKYLFTCLPFSSTPSR